MNFKKWNRPFYRDVLRDAFFLAWRHRKLWIFALFACILQTGGIIDVVLTSSAVITRQAKNLIGNGGWMGPPFFNTELSGVPGAISAISKIESLMLVVLLVITVFVVSVIAQGALAYGLGARTDKESPPFRACLTVGAKNFWSIAFLNIMTLGVMWLARFIVLIPYTYSITNATWLSVIGYIIAFFVFLVVVTGMTTIHMFSLNAIILRSETIKNALEDTYILFKKHWLMVVEVAALLFIIGFGLLLAAVTLTILAEIPLFLMLILAALFHWMVLLEFLFGMGIAVLVVIFGLFGVWSVSFQYAVWQRLYLRTEGGSVMSKIHRLISGLLDRKK